MFSDRTFLGSNGQHVQLAVSAIKASQQDSFFMNVTRLKPKMDKRRPVEISLVETLVTYVRSPLGHRIWTLLPGWRWQRTWNLKGLRWRQMVMGKEYCQIKVTSHLWFSLLLLQLLGSDCSKSKSKCAELEKRPKISYFAFSFSLVSHDSHFHCHREKKTTPLWTTQNVWIQFLLRGVKCVERSHQHSSFVAINHWWQRHKK